MEKKVRSIRADDEVFAKFKEVCEAAGGQQEALSTLIAAYELSTAKKLLSGQADSISDFQARIEGIMQAYISALEITANTEERIREEFRLHLDTQARTICNLQEQYQRLSSESALKSEEDKKRIEVLELELSRSNKQCQDLVKSENAAMTAKEQSDKIAAMSSKRIEQLEDEVLSLRAKAESSETNRQKAESFELQNGNLKNENEKLREQIQILKDKIAKDENEYRLKIDELNARENERRIQDENRHKKEVEIEVKSAKAEIKEQFIEKIEELQKEHSLQLAQLLKEAQNINRSS